MKKVVVSKDWDWEGWYEWRVKKLIQTTMEQQEQEHEQALVPPASASTMKIQ